MEDKLSAGYCFNNNSDFLRIARGVNLAIIRRSADSKAVRECLENPEKYLDVSNIIKDSRSTPLPMAIFNELYMDNFIVLQSLNDVYDSAEKNRYFGVSNFIQARIEQHMKHKWMLSSIIKRSEQA